MNSPELGYRVYGHAGRVKDGRWDLLTTAGSCRFEIMTSDSYSLCRPDYTFSLSTLQAISPSINTIVIKYHFHYRTYIYQASTMSFSTHLAFRPRDATGSSTAMNTNLTSSPHAPEPSQPSTSPQPSTDERDSLRSQIHGRHLHSFPFPSQPD